MRERKRGSEGGGEGGERGGTGRERGREGGRRGWVGWRVRGVGREREGERLLVSFVGVIQVPPGRNSIELEGEFG